MNIPYKREVTYSDLKNKGYLRFDFECTLYNRKFIIEVDGIQHERPVHFFGGTKSFNKLRYCDKIKDNYCKQNNLPLIRISHKDLTYDKVKNIILYKIICSNSSIPDIISNENFKIYF